MNWERFRDNAMRPEKDNSSIIVSSCQNLNFYTQVNLKDYEKIIAMRYIENEMLKPDFLQSKEYVQIRD